MAPYPQTSTAPPRVRVRRNGSTDATNTTTHCANAHPDLVHYSEARPHSPAGSAVSAPPVSTSHLYPHSPNRTRPATATPRGRVGPLYHTPSAAASSNARSWSMHSNTSSPTATAAYAAGQPAPTRAKVNAAALFPNPSPGPSATAVPRMSPSSRSGYDHKNGLASPHGSATSASADVPPRGPAVRKVQSANCVGQLPSHQFNPPSSASTMSSRTTPWPPIAVSRSGPPIAQARVHPSHMSTSPKPMHASSQAYSNPAVTSPSPHTFFSSPLGSASRADMSHTTFTRGGQGHGRTMSAGLAPSTYSTRSRSNSSGSNPSLVGMEASTPSQVSPINILVPKQRHLPSPEPDSSSAGQALESVSEVGEPLVGQLMSREPTAPSIPNIRFDARTRKIEEEAKKDRKILDLEISNRSLLAINEALEATKLHQTLEIRELKRCLRQARLHGPISGIDDSEHAKDEIGSSMELSGDEEDAPPSDIACGNESRDDQLANQDAPVKIPEDPELAALNLRCRKLVESMMSQARTALMFEPSKGQRGTGKVLHPAEVAALQVDANASLSMTTIDDQHQFATFDSSKTTSELEADPISAVFPTHTDGMTGDEHSERNPDVSTSNSTSASSSTSNTDAEDYHENVDGLRRMDQARTSRIQHGHMPVRVLSPTVLPARFPKPPRPAVQQHYGPPSEHNNAHSELFSNDRGVVVSDEDSTDDKEVSSDEGASPEIRGSLLSPPHQSLTRTRIPSSGQSVDISID